MISMATVVRILSAPTRQKRKVFSEIRQHNSVAPTREKILFHFLKKRRGGGEGRKRSNMGKLLLSTLYTVCQSVPLQGCCSF